MCIVLVSLVTMNNTQEKRKENVNEKSVIAYFSITTKLKVTIFCDNSTSIQFQGQKSSRRIHNQP